MRQGRLTLILLSLLLLPATPGSAEDDRAASSFEVAIETAEKALAQENLVEAERQVFRALERDARSPRAWALRARWAEAAGESGEQVYALHKQLALLRAQGAPKKTWLALRDRLRDVDPIAKRFLDLSATYLDKLMDLAKAYRKAKRPHSAIRVYQQALALDPDNVEAQQAIEAISAAPDPSLAETAKPKDLLADVSAEWIREFDAKHATWEARAELERDNYTTYTDAGYEVLVRCAEAMEQMNAFYRIFFQYGHEGGKSVPRLALNIFRERDTYLELGIGPPVDWSKGHFTGGAVETWIGSSGFDSMTGTLFHEAAHQFISLATNAVGWLNEGLACFFEGCRIQSNGTVLMNRPANGRLFSLASRMQAGWMGSAADGIDPADPSKSRPRKAPTFRILIENDYAWGPPWYAPTWGLVYFLYNYQDPIDGRFVYRNAFRAYIDTSGGRSGEGAVENFEKVILGNPQPLTKSLAKEKVSTIALPATVDEVDPVWKKWILALRDEQRGSLEVERAYLDWARYAIERKDYHDATEHFEKGLHETPRDVDLLEAFAEHLAGRMRNKDRATKLLHQAIQVLEAAEVVDTARLAALERRLERLDRSHRSLARVHRGLERAARGIAQEYLDAGHYLMAMHVSAGLGSNLRMPGMLKVFRDAVQRSGKTLALWQLAYNEYDLEGWATGGSKVFQPYGTILRATLGKYKPNKYDYSFLTMDKVTSGDFSLEAEVRSVKGENGLVGLVFGRKGSQAFHTLIYFPEGHLDLASFYGLGNFKTWRHESIDPGSQEWHKLRVDVTGRDVDVWFDDLPIASQTFPNKEVLQGTFGLLTGPGKAQFRHVRYLAREADDPGAAIERQMRLAKAGRAGLRKLGRYLGDGPPWPNVKAWLQAPRTNWYEQGLVPTLFVLWSMKQNELIPIDGWLRHMAKTHADVGLQIVSVCENADREAVEAYLAEHPFPGSVALDAFVHKKGGTGETMDVYKIARRGFPHVLLLDIDQRVVWEGNPGFYEKVPWKPGVHAYVDTPLAELIEKRNLRRLRPWLAKWKSTGRAAVERGALGEALPLLREAFTLPAEIVPAAAEARDVLGQVEALLGDHEQALATVVEHEAEPALEALLAWADLMERPVEGKPRQATMRVLRGKQGRAWKSALKHVARAAKALEGGRDLTKTVTSLLDKLKKLEGPLAEMLTTPLAVALAADDATETATLLREAPTIPARWLAHEFLHLH